MKRGGGERRQEGGGERRQEGENARGRRRERRGRSRGEEERQDIVRIARRALIASFPGSLRVQTTESWAGPGNKARVLIKQLKAPIR